MGIGEEGSFVIVVGEVEDLGDGFLEGGPIEVGRGVVDGITV